MAAPDISQVKQTMKAMWSAADFGKVAELMQRPAQEFVDRLNLKPGMRVLDVGCGTGNQSIPAARTGAHVRAVDIAPNLLAQTIERARQENLAIHVSEGDAEALPFGDDEFDVVLSMFAAIFAPRPEMVVLELVRVCRCGGLIAMGNWTPESFPGRQNRIITRFVPPPPGVPNPIEWGDESVVRQRFGSRAEVTTTRRPIVLDIPLSPKQTEEHFRRHIGPAHVSFSRLDAATQKQFAAEMAEHWARENRGDEGHTVVHTEYLEVHARPR
jgi:SAM-dependent methyltransferase